MTNYDTQRDRNRCDQERDQQTERQRPQRNPRLVIGTLDYFDMLMEQDEQG